MSPSSPQFDHCDSTDNQSPENSNAEHVDADFSVDSEWLSRVAELSNLGLARLVGETLLEGDIDDAVEENLLIIQRLEFEAA